PALAIPAESEWATSTREERHKLLTHLRGTHPARARELVESTWSQENADERQWQLNALMQGLGAEDEPLLERALDDRGKLVRRTAATLLTRIPQSRLVQRMRERVGALMAHVGNKIDVMLPTAVTPEMLRDGVEQQA